MDYHLTSIPDKAFAEDYRKALLEGRDVPNLKKVIGLLEKGIKLPRSYRQHNLNRKFQGFAAVHIEPDWILIYRIKGTDLLLARLGTHRELYGSKR